MQEQTIISKGKYGYPQTAGIVSLKHYFFVRDEKGQKRLLLRFFNERKEACTRFAFIIRFLDSRGKVIDEEKFEATDIKINGKKSYTFDEAIFVNEKCTTFKVEVLYASYDSYKYTNEGSGVAIEYERPEAVAKAKRTPKHTNAPRKIKVRSFKLSWVYMSLALILLSLAIAVISLQLYVFMQTEDEFTLDGIEYEFVSKTDGTVKITGCTGTYKNILIPSEIEGYQVIEVENGAFDGNRNIQKIRIEGVDIGRRTFANCINLTEIEITSVGSIEEAAFENCYNLQKVIISYPDAEEDENGETSLTPILQIGDRAFANCTSLKYVSIDQFADYNSSYEIFENDYEIKELYLKNFAYTDELLSLSDQKTSLAGMFNSSYGYGTRTPMLEKIKIDYIDNIPAYFCQDFNMLTSFEIGESPVSTIGRSAFDGCVQLTSLSFGFPVRIIEDRAFAETAITSFVASDISSIGNEAFLNCRALSQFSLSGNNTIKTIGNKAFKGCTSLASISLPSTLTILGKGALQNTALKSFKYSNSELEIEQGVLHGCTSITELDLATIPEAGIGYLFISPDKFFNEDASTENILREYISELSKVKNLVKITLSGNATEITKLAFAGCESLQAVSLPSGITTISEYAFSGCKKLVDINLGTKIEYIGKYAFENTGITAFTLPKDVTVVSEGLFYGCESLASVTLHENVTGISEAAFKYCKSLSAIDLCNVKSIDSYAFEGTSIEKIIIPKDTEYVGTSILKDCEKLKELNVPLNDYVQSVYKYVIEYYWYDTNVFSSVEKITVSAGEAIEENTFYGFKNVEEIVLENGITYVYGSAFGSLKELRRLVIPETVLLFDISGIDGAYRLYEICNLSQVNLTVDSLPNTIYISTSQDNVAPHVYANGYEFALYGDNWYLVNWDNDKTSITPSYDFIYPASEYEYISVAEWKVPPSLFRETSVNSISLPSSVTEIGKRAFYSCGASSIELDYYMPLITVEDDMFRSCSLLTSVSLPSTVESIGKRAFSGCHSLTSIILPTYVYTIGNYAFSQCYNLETIAFSSSLELVGDNAFDSCTSLKKAVFTSPYLYGIGASAFYDCNSLEELSFNSVCEIGDYAFYNCYSLESVALPSTLIYLGQSAFENCTDLESVVLSFGLTEINQRTFAFCYSLDEIVIPDTVTTVWAYAFQDCTSLNTITLGENLKELNETAFYGSNNVFDIYNLSYYLNIEEGSKNYYSLARKAFVHYDKYESISQAATVSGFGEIRYYASRWVVFSVDPAATSFNTNNLYYDGIAPSSIRFLSTSTDNGSSLESVVFGDNVTGIHSSAFSYNTKLKTVDFSQNTRVKTIEDSAFRGCSKLMAVSLPQNLEIIEYDAFCYSTKLLSIALPSTLLSIGSDAFYGCEQLLEVYDFTPYLSVSKGSYGYGYVGFYAKEVFTSPYDELERIVIDGFYFVRSGDICYLHHYEGEWSNLLTIPETGYSVAILGDAFDESGASSVVLPKSLISIYVDYSNYGAMDNAYYMGAPEEWYSVSQYGSYYVYPYFYDTCVHESGTWTYKDGKITKSACQLEWGIEKAPTCYSYGEEVGRCTCEECDYEESITLPIVAHDFVDGVCSYCQKQYRTVTSENMDEYSDIFELDLLCFTIDEEGKISSSKEYTTYGEVVLIVKQDIEIEYQATVNGGISSLKIYRYSFSYNSVWISAGQTKTTQMNLYGGDMLVFEYTTSEEAEAIINYIKVLLD